MNVETAVNTCDGANYVGVLSGRRASVNNGRIELSIKPNSGEIWVPEELLDVSIAPIKTEEIVTEADAAPLTDNKVENLNVSVSEESNQDSNSNDADVVTVIEEVKPDEIIEDTTKQNNECSAKEATEEPAFDWSKPYEEMSVEQLQEAILEKMRNNGPVTDYMLKTVRENTHIGSLINWVKSFR